MIAPGRPSSFFREVGLGLVLSLAGAATFAALSFLMPQAAALRLVESALAFVYAMLIVARTSKRPGRVLAVLAWCVLIAASLSMPLALPAHAGVLVLAIWSTRALLAGTGPVSAGLDLGLAFVAVGFAAWAALRTGGVFLPLWCFFLIQALHVVLPRLGAPLGASRAGNRPVGRSSRRFEQAFSTADEALQRIAARR